jgi:acyl carrier protein
MPAGETVEEALKRIVLKITRKKDTSFSKAASLTSLGADSLDRVQIVIALEDEYGIEICDEEISRLPDMASVINLIENKIAAKPQDAA